MFLFPDKKKIIINYQQEKLRICCNCYIAISLQHNVKQAILDSWSTHKLLDINVTKNVHLLYNK
jgi:hypothetical protein